MNGRYDEEAENGFQRRRIARISEPDRSDEEDSDFEDAVLRRRRLEIEASNGVIILSKGASVAQTRNGEFVLRTRIGNITWKGINPWYLEDQSAIICKKPRLSTSKDNNNTNNNRSTNPDKLSQTTIGPHRQTNRQQIIKVTTTHTQRPGIDNNLYRIYQTYYIGTNSDEHQHEPEWNI